MSLRNITVTTSSNNVLELLACRQVQITREYKGFLAVPGTARRRVDVMVQYGMGVTGNGRTLKEAVADFQRNWTAFVAA